MSDLTPITREEALLDGADLEPITRKEQFIKRIYDKTQEVPEPITREEWFLNKAGEGGGGVTVEQLNVTENGTYSEQGKAYSPVIVEVPQTTVESLNITANGTYTAPSGKAYSPVTVNVEGFKKKSIANTPTDIASFNDGTANPMPSLEISIEPVQSGSGDPSPSNVRPISGWSVAKIADDAEYGGFINWNQLIDKSKLAAQTSPPVTFTPNQDGSVTVVVEEDLTSVVREYFTVNSVTNYINIPANHKYVIYSNTTRIENAVFLNGTIGASLGWNVVRTAGNTDLTLYLGMIFPSGTPAGTYKVIPQIIDLTQLFGSTIADYIYSLEQATAGAGVAYFRNLFPKDYYPYNAGEITTVSAVNGDVDKYSITSTPFHDSSDNPITVYGGTLNVTSGELRVTHANIASYNGETINEPWISSMDVYSEGATPTTGAQVVYPLATPQTYQLTLTQVSTLLGQNNIFADCGQILDGEYFVTL